MAMLGPRGITRLTVVCLLVLAIFEPTAHAQEEYQGYQDLYCGNMDCYSLLGVERDASKADIAKAYRKLAKVWHPDKAKTPEEKKQAEAMFLRIAAGYEVLKEDESRKEYDYMMDHPEEYYGNYYRYYKRRMAPKIDVRIVIFALISMISMVQYYSAWYNHHETISYLATVPKYRYQALELARQRGLPQRKEKIDRKEEKAADERMIRQIISEMMDTYGGFEKPQIDEILWVQIVTFPYKFYKWTTFNTGWIWRFWICRQEFGDKEKEYLIRRNLGLSIKQWMALPQSELEMYMERQLWRKDRWQEWKEEKEEEERVRQAQSGRSKQERRWLKNNDNRMTFDENYDW